MPISEQDQAVSEQTIRERAYALYEQRGRDDGRAEEDWFQAESELSVEAHHQEAA